ncbi:ribonuclease G [Periweissella fabalis]|uniref:Ribonuclease G n=1 Tax=Periweissella fabalis TaxID=1070421 RepID=A0A7X6N3E0_9LACO|nr:ribonuclease G [Periweissella fabalis]MCM0598428.1 ribonuclease G [Periweissella fabalis]NKZ25051.1 ribonuclease G [Periweissella fabalis]
MFNFYWGLGNKSYLPLLCLITVFNIIWAFVCGIKGNEWAWTNGAYQDVETFQAVQKTWNRAGLFAFIMAAIGIILVILFYIFIFAAVFVNYQNNGGSSY